MTKILKYYYFKLVGSSELMDFVIKRFMSILNKLNCGNISLRVHIIFAKVVLKYVSKL